MHRLYLQLIHITCHAHAVMPMCFYTYIMAWTMLVPKIIFLYVMKWLLCLLVIHISQICKFMHLLFLSIQLCFTDY